jgi:hypothetical protein
MKKLSLKRSTVQVLSSPTLREVNGARSYTVYDGCSYSCTNPGLSLCVCETNERACFSVYSRCC